MKSWDPNSWVSFVKIFKAVHPDVRIVQLGGKDDKAIPGVDVSMVGQLDFSDSLKYLKGAVVHVDGDSGIVHARRLFNKPSVVIFGPTNPKYFGYPENVNLEPGFCGDCWWKKPDWMRKCVLDYPAPRCMDSTSPQLVVSAVSALL
jgi:ADP-heptose:LPS heptosyltransferase